MTRTARMACARRNPKRYSGSFEEAQLVHEPFGVQRPALAVARDPRPALEAIEAVAQVPHLADLQMMAGYALVVRDRHLAPQREPRLAQGRVPRAPGPAEVLRRSRVVHRRRAARWCDHRLDPLHGIGDVEVHAVHGVDGRVHQLLEPVRGGSPPLRSPDRSRFRATRWSRRCRCPRAVGLRDPTALDDSSRPRCGTARPSPTGRSRRSRCRHRASRARYSR